MHMLCGAVARIRPAGVASFVTAQCERVHNVCEVAGLPPEIFGCGSAFLHHGSVLLQGVVELCDGVRDGAYAHFAHPWPRQLPRQWLTRLLPTAPCPG